MGECFPYKEKVGSSSLSVGTRHGVVSNPVGLAGDTFGNEEDEVRVLAG